MPAEAKSSVLLHMHGANSSSQVRAEDRGQWHLNVISKTVSTVDGGDRTGLQDYLRIYKEWLLLDKDEKSREGEARILEDDGPRPGSSQNPTTSSPYPDFYIGRLTIHQVLGRGGFGKVYLASLLGRNTFMAVKVVTKTGRNTAVLMREQQILQKVRDCPFLCHLYAAHQSRDAAYFITEYLSGGSLEDLLRMRGSLNIDNVRSTREDFMSLTLYSVLKFYTAEIACGLQFLHRHNIVHSDLKPANIMLDGNGHIRLIDLGIARDGVTSSSKIQGKVGTTGYKFPEVLLRNRRPIGTGILLSYELIVYRMAIRFSPFYHGGNITTDKPKLPSWLDADLKDLLLILLEINPEKWLDVNSNFRDHPFFNTICWEDLESRRAQPPFIPFKAVLENKDLPWL
ncbi:protein kinase C delta type-like [Leptodactylus fuscus]